MPAAGRVLLRDDEVRGDEVRVAYTWLARHSDPSQLVLMQVAETKGKRSTLATEIIKGVMVPQFVTEDHIAPHEDILDGV